jgi:hypothetical protein
VTFGALPTVLGLSADLLGGFLLAVDLWSPHPPPSESPERGARLRAAGRFGLVLLMLGFLGQLVGTLLQVSAK